MNDDRMDELLAEAARDYNAPADVPRDEIWSRIQAERGARGGLDAQPAFGLHAVHHHAAGVRSDVDDGHRHPRGPRILGHARG